MREINFELQLELDFQNFDKCFANKVKKKLSAQKRLKKLFKI